MLILVIIAVVRYFVCGCEGVCFDVFRAKTKENAHIIKILHNQSSNLHTILNFYHHSFNLYMNIDYFIYIVVEYSSSLFSILV